MNHPMGFTCKSRRLALYCRDGIYSINMDTTTKPLRAIGSVHLNLLVHDSCRRAGILDISFFRLLMPHTPCPELFQVEQFIKFHIGNNILTLPEDGFVSGCNNKITVVGILNWAINQLIIGDCPQIFHG